MNLLPCPFCGGEAKLYSIGTGSPHYGHYHQVVCQGCLTASGAYWSGEQSAIDAWNTRAERTCKEYGSIRVWQSCNVWSHELSCGHEVDTLEKEPPNYCPNCGAKVVKE